MLTPAELREQSQRYRDASEGEATPELRRRLASHAQALIQLADRLERPRLQPAEYARLEAAKSE